MTPERWKQVSALYDGARARQPGARAAFLAEACGSDEVLRRDVQALLDQPTSPAGLDGLTPSAVAGAMGPEAGADLTGRQFGTYRLQERIGAGGMGEVYRARDTRLGRDVAVKVLPPAFADDPDRVARFDREARVLASLDHPNIGAIHGVEESPQTGSGQAVKALVLALVEGDTLADRIARGALPIPEALGYGKQIADALEAAHDNGIVHRDLKPGNIKITPAGVIKVLDFGLAKLWTGDTGDTGGDHLTHSPVQSAGTRMGMILGTAAYMSPEQARGKPVDRRTDIWAFGCVMFEMLTGARAFPGQDVADVLARVIEREPDFKRLPSTTPSAVRRLLRRSLEKDHRKRLSDIADARLEIDEAIAEPDAPIATRTGERWRVVTVASLLAAVTLSGLVALYFSRGAPELAISRFEIVTPSPTFDSAVTLSPDGRQLVFIANVGGQQQLWIRPLDQTLAQPLAGTEGASFPFWAPDSRSVAFFADGKLKRLALSGGQPIELAEAPIPLGGAWSSDGTILFAQYERRSFTKLMRVPATSGVATRVPGTDFGSPRFPEFLPDGRRFLFLMRWTGVSGDRDGVYLGSLDTPEVRRLPGIDAAAVYAPPGFLLFVRQGTLMALSFDTSSGTVVGEPLPVASIGNSIPDRRGAFSVSSTGLLAYRAGPAPGLQLTWFDRRGAVVGTMGRPERGPFASPELAPDGRRVAIGRGVAGDIDVWLLEAAADAWNRFTFSPGAENSPVWAPDGSRVAFALARQRQFLQIFEKPSDGSGNERLLLTSNSDEVIPVDWSPDSRTLLYTVHDPKTDGDLWALPLTGDPTPFPVVRTQFLEDEGQFSPDGRWIAFRSNRSGREEIYVQAFRGSSGSQLVSTLGGSQPRWGRDGRELFYIAPDNMLMVVAIGPGASQGPETGKPAPLFRTRLEAGVLAEQQYAVAPDGQRFLMNVLAEETNVPPITIVQNWTLGLKR
jgi:serine/threonine protein kinase/Tol biopolymer transport system component